MKATFRVCQILTLLLAGGAAALLGAQAPVAPAMSALEKEADAPFRAGDWAKAAAAYAAVAKAEPANGRAHFRLGMAYLSLNQYAPAAAAFEESQKLKFAPALGSYNLACALAHLGRSNEAIAALNAAFKAGYTNYQQMQADEDLANLRDDAGFTALAAQMQRATKPCEFDDHYKQFDFWVGEWTVVAAGASPNAPPASLPQSRIEKILNGCVVLENWMPPNSAGGKSFNTYNTATGKWEQFWVSGTGGPIHFIGEARDGNMHFTSDFTDAKGQRTMGKMSYFNLGPDRLRQLWETSTDGGKTWTVAFDGIYMRKR